MKQPEMDKVTTDDLFDYWQKCRYLAGSVPLWIEDTAGEKILYGIEVAAANKNLDTSWMAFLAHPARDW